VKDEVKDIKSLHVISESPYYVNVNNLLATWGNVSLSRNTLLVGVCLDI
jgi:hypothetical protein